MPLNIVQLPSQAIFPLGVALTSIVLCVYVSVWRKMSTGIERLFLLYLFLTTLWNVTLMVAVQNMADPLPGLTWAQLIIYGLALLGLIYWAFSRAFLYLSWGAISGWLLGIAGIGAAISLDRGWFTLPPEALVWSNGWLTNQNLGFTLSVSWWGLFMGLAALTSLLQQFRTQSPAHRNRIQYLLISITLLVVGYILYLSLQEPFWTIGLIVTGLGCVLSAYIVVAENLIDLGTGIRRLIRGLVITLATVSAYILGVYLVQLFLGDLLTTTFGSRIDQTLLITTVSVVFLTFIYTPIRQISQRVVNRLMFGRSYDYQEVIQSYGEVISNRLYLGELATMATEYINHAMALRRSALFIFDSESEEHIHLRTLPAVTLNGSSPKQLSLQKNTPITQHLIEEHRPLAQYAVDISSQFKKAPETDRQTLKSLNYEWFVPIHKDKDLIGLLAVGTKKSRRPHTNRDLSLLTTLADQTALALENAKLFDRVQRNLEEITGMKNLMDNVFDSMDNGVITTDSNGRITFYNEAAEKILAMSLQQTIGSPYSEAFPTLANTIFSNLVNNVLKREESYTNYEIISELPQRGRVNLSISLTSLKDGRNQPQGVTIVVDDLTETKRLQAVHDMFRRYVSPAVVDRLPSDPKDLELGGHRQEATILFADIRGFTTFSEKLTPEALVDVLNQYLSMAASAILMYEGTLDKFMGDAVMGIFNAPLKQEDHVLRAVRAAAAMQRAITDHHRTLGENRGLQFGVGLHVGEVVVGNVGMSDRMDYTAIGDAVNLAKRIQENTPGGKVLMSDAVYDAVKDYVNAIFYQEIKVKGREQMVKLYELRLAE